MHDTKYRKQAWAVWSASREKTTELMQNDLERLRSRFKKVCRFIMTGIPRKNTYT